jgi:hypothetical protein
LRRGRPIRRKVVALLSSIGSDSFLQRQVHWASPQKELDPLAFRRENRERWVRSHNWRLYEDRFCFWSYTRPTFFGAGRSVHHYSSKNPDDIFIDK